MNSRDSRTEESSRIQLPAPSGWLPAKHNDVISHTDLGVVGGNATINIAVKGLEDLRAALCPPNLGGDDFITLV